MVQDKVYMMFCYEIPWFYEDLKNENLFFLNLYTHSSRSENRELPLGISKGFPFMPEQI